MRVVFRTDASTSLGTGHVARCLTLAQELARHGAEVWFLSQGPADLVRDLLATESIGLMELPPAQSDFDWRLDAQQSATSLRGVPRPIDWLIVDHYRIAQDWEAALRPVVGRILVLDDLADRRHDCDVLVDPTYGETAERYIGLVPAHAQVLCGTDYAMLRPQFERQRALRPRGEAGEGGLRAHVFFGGADQANHTARYSHLLLENFSTLSLKIAVGAAFKELDDLRALSQRFGDRVEWDRGVSDMAAHMAGAQVAIGAPGTATWERACLGVPGAYLATTDNQLAILRKLEREGFCCFIGDARQLEDDAFVRAMARFLDDPHARLRMSELGLAAVDGRGVPRVAELVLAGAQP